MASLDPILVSPPFDSSLDVRVNDWNKKFLCKTLSSEDFRQFWAKNVPVIFCPKSEPDSATIKYDEEAANRVLFAPLEQFICGSKETDQMFDHLRTLNETPSLCGRVFKSGEPTYSCRDCGLDPTCVLCVDCFTNSAHRFHRYKMSASGGGGYCDCGDEEAWKTHSYCDNHHKNKAQKEEEAVNPVDKLPSDVVERLRTVIGIVLNYCHLMLTLGHEINLPADLQCSEDKNNELPDTYCTMLFNDETHTYDQVIDTLSKAIHCRKKTATDFATLVDREGRSIVMCSTFATCNQVRHVIERITSRQASKLKVSVMHRDVVAHQTFALRLLAWLQKIVALNEGFCQVFTSCILEDRLLEKIMLVDTQLWKCGRNHWHQLLIAGMLMEPGCKKAFARCFTQCYPQLMKEFIADDHDHSVSVISLSVQVYTVPTLAHALIREENAVAVVLRAFLSECERNKNEEGRLAFQRNQNYQSFRRAQYMLYDLGYLVTVVPPEWNDELRKSFRNGMQSFFSLLCAMQGMDAVRRQEGQHVEYEAEWETGINLQLKVASVGSLLLKWCGSDYAVFVKTFRNVLKHFRASHTETHFVGVELANHSASCIQYDVSKQAVTIHLPLVRFIAGMFLCFERFHLSYESPQFLIDNFEKPSPEQLMELSLRTLVMLAQFRAGMWRRNGYSLLNQVYFYHNVRLRDEMYDRDVLMLQICASMIESNEFLIHLVYKYGLLNWADEGYETTKDNNENIRQVLTVVEEFLGLILTIVSERYVPGLGKVSESDRVKKEVIQLLCMEPMPHSKLFKMLPRDQNSLTEREVREVATFRKPPSTTGKYELKPEYYAWFNPFYFHYTREEQSKAEEVQMKRKKQQCPEDLCCLLPPVPPEFVPRYTIIINILQCDVMLHIMELVLKRTLNLHSAAFSETQLEKVLHLMGVALHDEERLTLTEKESFFCFTSRANRRNILGLLEECLKAPRVELCGEPQKDLLSWVIKKYRDVEALHTRASEESSSGGCAQEGGGSSEGGAADGGSTTTAEAASSSQDRKRKAEMAAARRARIMAQMSAMQKNFIREHADMFREEEQQQQSSTSDHPLLSQSEMDIYAELQMEDPVCFYKDARWRIVSPKVYTCILCREDQELSSSGAALVLAAFVQRSSVLSKDPKHRMQDPESWDPLTLPADLFYAPHVSTCGHLMHADCWHKFFESVQRREQRRPLRFGRHTSFDVEKSEFLCPLCERLSNTVIPLLPPLTTLLPPGVKGAEPQEISADDWLSSLKKVVQGFQMESLEEEPAIGDDLKLFPFRFRGQTLEGATRDLVETSREGFVGLFTPFETEETVQESLSPNLQEMMQLFHKACYNVGFTKDVGASDVRAPAMTWWACTYTLHALEWLLREKGKPLFGALSARSALCLDATVRFCGASLRLFDPRTVRTNCLRILRYLLLGDHHLSSGQCCLDLDAFSVLAFLALSMPVLFERSSPAHSPLLQPLGTQLDRHLLHLVLTFHFVQVLLTYPFQEEDQMETEEEGEGCEGGGEGVTSLLFYEEVRTAAGYSEALHPSAHTVVHCLKEGSLPFLRCAALFYHVITDTPPPTPLQDVATGDREFEALCKYLALPPTLDELLAPPSLKHLALSWARHPRTLHLLLGSDGGPVRHPLSVNRLVTLPSDYSDLINGVSQFVCPEAGDESRNPTLCLVCGALLCSQNYCCQRELRAGQLVGACTAHAHTCGAGAGIFLRIRDCKVLLLSDRSKGCFTSPPYVDDYGETDQGLVRGNPLHLCPDRYRELHELWLSHNIPEHVSHRMEQSTTIPNWPML